MSLPFPNTFGLSKKQTVCHQKICSVEHETFRASNQNINVHRHYLGEEGEVEEDEGHKNKNKNKKVYLFLGH